MGSFSRQSWSTSDMSHPVTVTGAMDGEQDGCNPYIHGLCPVTGHTTLNYNFDKQQQEGQVQNEWRVFNGATAT